MVTAQEGCADLPDHDVAIYDLGLERAASGRRASSAQLRERSRRAAHGSAGLTERELAILEQIAAGKSNDQIAEDLYLSINTVKTNIRTAYKRIGVTTRSQAVIWAIGNDLAGAATA